MIENKDKFYLRGVGNFDEIPAEFFNHEKEMMMLSDMIMEKTKSDKSFKLLKCRYDMVLGIYYHKDILDDIMVEKNDLIYKLEEEKSDKLKAIQELEDFKNNNNNKKKSLWGFVKNIF